MKFGLRLANTATKTVSCLYHHSGTGQLALKNQWQPILRLTTPENP